MNRLNDVTIVIRSVGERTEGLCRQLILSQGIPEENLFLIHERPFSRAMRKGYQLGADQKRTWTYCVDADVLLRDGAICKMISIIKEMPEQTLGVSGELLDKFRGKKKSAGNHLFRTKYLPALIEVIKPYEEESIRPESSAIKRLCRKGYQFKKNVLYIGLHDFEQHYHDIARKAFTHSIKHGKYLSELVHFWKKRATHDPDFQAALLGLSKGVLHVEDKVKINVNDFKFLQDAIAEEFDTKSEQISDFDIQSADEVTSNMNKQENLFTVAEELNDHAEKQFRTQFNQLNYVDLLRRFGGKIISDIKNKIK
ncbi:MAG: hypothetical protein JJU28_19555 [Cyclobacteriaceae bacterium]|nr:hypothetical protein [Cyclobacteriaceae bacterium]